MRRFDFVSLGTNAGTTAEELLAHHQLSLLLYQVFIASDDTDSEFTRLLLDDTHRGES